uniref:Uncharacterized protein n=1 Tax=Anguilla anguilla TaxID=7936 RepID=A0A0E9PGW5_ANGAN
MFQLLSVVTLPGVRISRFQTLRK